MASPLSQGKDFYHAPNEDLLACLKKGKRLPGFGRRIIKLSDTVVAKYGFESEVREEAHTRLKLA